MHRLLGVMFDKYEDGTPCYDEPEDGTFIGYAFRIDDEDFSACVKALATPDTSAQILARRDAAVLQSYVDGKIFGFTADRVIYKSEAYKSDELLKGLEKECG